MTDLEAVKLCAEAMGVRLEWDGPPADWQPMYYEGKTYHIYEPLHDKAQAFELVERFPFIIEHNGLNYDVQVWNNPGAGWMKTITDDDLARAIVTCVANMQAARRKEGE
jgi:hypothetical protein